jgi:hypothetical protein
MKRRKPEDPALWMQVSQNSLAGIRSRVLPRNVLAALSESESALARNPGLEGLELESLLYVGLESVEAFQFLHIR